MLPSHENPLSRLASKSLIVAAALTFTYFLVELFGGIFTGSLALLADSSHMAGDFLSLVFAWSASYLARRPTNLVKTYGYHRVEVLAALVNVMTLWVISGVIIANAIGRLKNPPLVLAGPMTAIAAIGLVINLICAVILSKQSKANLNVRGAYLHVLSDALGSVGAIGGGLWMRRTGNFVADPIVSGFICMLIILSSLKLMASSLNILLEGVPPHLSVAEIKQAILAINGVEEIHDLHVWSMGSGLDMLSGHVLIAKSNSHDSCEIIEEVNAVLREKFGIEHATLQAEIKSEEQKN